MQYNGPKEDMQYNGPKKEGNQWFTKLYIDNKETYCFGK
jgi:hypothetical protein